MASTFDPFKAFGSGGLTIQSAGSSSVLPQGPGQGYYGANDLFSKGSVLGASSYSPASQAQTPTPSGVTPTVNNNAYRADQLAGINDKYNALSGSINDALGGLNTTNQSLVNQANTAYSTGVNRLGTQRDTQTAETQKQQTSNLRDLGSNISNLFTAGNTYLGARGAGDSSAANQYSYALTRLGTQERSKILSSAQDRLSQINNIYNDGINQLEYEKSTQLANIAQWFNDSQNQLKAQLGQVGAGRADEIRGLSQDLYNQALQAVGNLQNEIANRRSTLESWAASNSQNINQLVGNLSNVASLPQYQGVDGMPQVTPEGGYIVPSGYGSSERKDIFGNVIR